jgi:gliding motility-associated lipoprotein GldD
MKNYGLYCLVFISTIIFACSNPDYYTPKPRGYYHITFPQKKYQHYKSNGPYTFDYPVYATISSDLEQGAGSYWKNLNYPSFNARLHLTYYQINSRKEFAGLVEDARTLVFKHTVKASSIDQKLINFPDKNVYGIYYAIEGNTASSIQFFLTDSAKHYFRGALYFNERPQYDSIAPVLKFIKQDVDVMINTFKWKN